MVRDSELDIKVAKARRLLDVEAAVCFLEHSKRTHEKWAAWLGLGHPVSEDAGDLEHHQRCVLEYEHILDVFLAQPEPAAREAVYVTALRAMMKAAPQSIDNTLGHDLYQANRFAADILADTSPTAAALLAQGERLERVKEWQEEWDGVGTVDWAALSAIMEKPRAVLAPGETKDV